MGCGGSKFVGPYDDKDWKELPDEVKEAAKVLGYTKKIWDNDGKLALEENEWEELTAAQQTAATTLGFNEQAWNAS